MGKGRLQTMLICDSGNSNDFPSGIKWTWLESPDIETTPEPTAS